MEVKSLVETKLNPADFVLLPEEFKTKYPEKVIAVGALLDSGAPHPLLKPFSLGSNAVIFYGQPLSLIAGSKLFAELLSPEEIVNPRPLGLLSDVLLTPENLPSLTLVWLVINGIITVDQVQELGLLWLAEPGRLLMYALEAWSFTNYFNFNIPHFTLVLNSVLAEAVRTLPSDAKLSERLKRLLAVFYDYYLGQVIKLPYQFSAITLTRIAQILGEPYVSQTNLLFMSREDLVKYLETHYPIGTPISDLDRNILTKLYEINLARYHQASWEEKAAIAVVIKLLARILGIDLIVI